MSTTTKRLIAGSQLTGTAATYYTVPANTRAVLKAASLTNTTAGAVACTVYLVPSGGSAGASNAIISAKSVAANETYSCPELVNQVLESGYTVQAFGLNVTFMASGIEIV
jgi:hypothetical protein